MKLLVAIFILLSSTVACFAGESTITFTYAGQSRSSLIYVPNSYNANTPSTLVLCLHGTTQLNTVYRDLINMYPIADTANFIVLIPQGLYDLVAGFTWNSGAGAQGYYPNSSVDDIGFLKALLDTVKANYNVNSNGVFATGFSMGGFMCNKIACNNTLGIKAIASVAGTIGSGVTCNTTTPMPFMHIHGTSDGVVGYTANNFGTDAEPTVKKWITVNGCDTNAIVTNITNSNNDNITFTHYKYNNPGNPYYDVEFYKANGANHVWYTSNQDINYSKEIWLFFKRHIGFATAVNQTTPQATILSTSYYNLWGQPITNSKAAIPGTMLQITRYSDGSTKQKMIVQ
ncbi:MAG: hypothetical protein RL660_1929 [Bacteroidota bacterium]|jgi:polyhydroxybutyrate depolymerase